MRATATERRAFWLFALLAIIVLGAGLGLRDPWPADEPRFALSAKQMVDSGNWLIPHRGSELYSDKPPLFMAAQALSFELTGNPSAAGEGRKEEQTQDVWAKLRKWETQ